MILSTACGHFESALFVNSTVSVMKTVVLSLCFLTHISHSRVHLSEVFEMLITHIDIFIELHC